MKSRQIPKKTIIRRIVLIAVAAVLLLTAVPFCVSGIVYSAVFTGRFETADYLRYDVSEFEGLKEERLTFKSCGRSLQGYLYSVDEADMPKGVVVVCHGFGGGGANQYMDSAYLFARNGYYVFMFDAAGNDLSEGSGTEGIPQYTLDLDAAIGYVKEDGRLKDLPVMLFGHSMGGFSVLNVLNLRDDVAAVAVLSGFCDSSDMIVREGMEKAGPVSLLLLPYVKLFEKIKFGLSATEGAIAGLKKSSCRVLVAHSSDDETVPIGAGLGKLEEEFSGDGRFAFVKFDDRGHNYVDFSDEALDYVEEFNKGFEVWFNETSPTASERSEYMREHLDRGLWTNALDGDLYEKIIDMFNAAAEERGLG